ncbi:MAG: hypothetical protein ACI9O4_001544 [Chitinophagales bacterium]|jgi:hypothetical protein
MQFKKIITWILSILLVSISLSSCKEDNVDCSRQLFGRPINTTGLDDSQCTPVCQCEGFASTYFSQEDIDNIRTWTLTNSIALLGNNPYDLPAPIRPEGICAVVVEDLNLKTYHLENYTSPEAALADGAILTHFDVCGKCSSLEDFAVYAENLDVGADVRQCILSNLNTPFEDLVLCIEAIGFTKPCAQIWAYNAKNTQTECFAVCISDTLYNQADGSLSDCLQCDETKSGPVFKAIAGRTRRNTGIASSICRFCEEVQIVTHKYPN